YQAVSAIKRVADEHETAILLIHHLRKMESSDPFDCFSGTLGLTGAADTLLVMQRNTNGQTVLSVKGRDVEGLEVVMQMDPAFMSWKLVGEAAEVRSTQQQQKLYNALTEEIPMSPKELAGATGLKTHYIKKTLAKLVKDGVVLKKERGGYLKGTMGTLGTIGTMGTMGTMPEGSPNVVDEGTQ
ncbi:MAG: helicase RepA family protein, partial [Actinobacteria bacterium]|nr:helicase RepA family protein [Actinomycetota bacterium]